MSKKPVVLETGADWAIILKPNGEYKKVKNTANLQVGELYKEVRPVVWKYAAAAVLLLTVVLATVDYFTVQAYAQVSSVVELGINRWGRVVSARAATSEGEAVLRQLEVNNDKLEEAVEKVYRQLLKDKPAGKVITEPVLKFKNNNKDKSSLHQNLQLQIDKGINKAVKDKKNEDKSNNQSSSNNLPDSKTNNGNAKKGRLESKEDADKTNNHVPTSSSQVKGQDTEGKNNPNGKAKGSDQGNKENKNVQSNGKGKNDTQNRENNKK